MSVSFDALERGQQQNKSTGQFCQSSGQSNLSSRLARLSPAESQKSVESTSRVRQTSAFTHLIGLTIDDSSLETKQ
eukprot:scaffold443_cov125-Cylindrotheca_fusiformis.AAC.32